MSAEKVKLGYKRTEVGVIPEDWSAKTIGDGIDLLTGFPFPSSEYSDSGVKLLRGSNVKRGQTDWSEEITQYWPLVTQEIARYELREGDLVIAMDGSLVGRSYAKLAKYDLPALLLQRVARIRSTQKLDASYLATFIGSNWFIKHADSVKTVTAIPHISPADISSFSIPIPPTLEEQRAIATALSDVDALLAKLDQLIAKKRDLKQAAMQQLLTGQTRLPGFSGEWEVKRLGDVLRFQVGFPFSSNFFNQEGGGLRLVKNRDLKADDQIFFFSGKFDDSFIIKDGDVLIGMDGDFLPCLWSKGNALLNQRVGRIVPSSRVSALFSYYMLTEPLKSIEYSTAATTVKHLSHGDVERIEWALPEVDEQTAIATVLSDMDSELAALESRRDKARALKQGMMQELLTGRIRLV
jgi:type I restriction enzyme, S subunit